MAGPSVPSGHLLRASAHRGDASRLLNIAVILPKESVMERYLITCRLDSILVINH